MHTHNLGKHRKNRYYRCQEGPTKHGHLGWKEAENEIVKICL
jgi:hypothetical protein